MPFDTVKFFLFPKFKMALKGRRFNITGYTYPVLNTALREMLQMVAQSLGLLYKVPGILL